MLDVSEQALAVGRSRLGSAAAEVSWIAADATSWIPQRRYGLWHDRAVLHFLVEGADQAAYVAALRAAITPGGAVVIGGFAPDGPEACSGLPVARRGPEELLELLGAGFALVASKLEVHRTPAGLEQRFSWVALRAEEPS